MDEIFTRPGKFRIDTDIIRVDPRVVIHVMSRVLVVSAVCQYCGVIEYEGFSDEFDLEIEKGFVHPYYDVVVTVADDGSKSISFKRRI
jgi:hypothetical protein